MGLRGFAGSGNEARVWRLANEGEASSRAVRIAGSTSLPATPPGRADIELPESPHLLTAGSRVDAGPDTLAAVLPLLGGGSMASRLTATGPLPAEDCAKVLASVRDGLATLHSVGLVHLDVSPANILLTSAGLPVLGDTRGVLAADGRIARRGTPPYTVPGADATPSTDWVALGRVLTELASGSPITQTSHLPTDLQAPITTMLEGRDPQFDQPVGPGNLDTIDDRLLDVHESHYVVPTSQRTTLEFVGLPDLPDSPSPTARGWGLNRRTFACLTATAAAVAACSFVAIGSTSTNCGSPFASSSADHGFTVVHADTDGACPTAVLWSQGDGVMIVPTSDGPQRFELGKPGDVLSIGDWDCNGSVTPALTRDERLFVFHDWPQHAPVQATEFATSRSAPAC